jgi:hypothetical protein
LRTCRLFIEGGDYDQKEVDLLKAKLDKVCYLLRH